MKPKVALWIKGALAAVVSGGATVLGSLVLDGEDLDLAGLVRLGKKALLGGVVGLALYLKQSPLPPRDSIPPPPMPPPEPR